MTETTEHVVTPEVKKRVLVATILGAGIVFLDSSVANVALPAIQREFDMPTAAQQWVASSFLLVLSVLLLVGGRLADVFGRKRLFVTGLWAYSILALATAASPSPTWLIVLRGMQGAAGALLVPTTLALINATFRPEERGKAIGTWAAWSGITTVLGPIVGGYAIDSLSWRWAFLLAPVVAVVALVSVRGVPESADPSASRRIDILGSVLVVLSLTGVVYALIEAPVLGWGAPQVIASLTAGIMLLPVFVWWQTRAARPVLPLAVFENRNLAAANVGTFFVYA